LSKLVRNGHSIILFVAAAAILGLSGCRNVAGLFLPVDTHSEVIAESKEALVAERGQRLATRLERLESQSGTRSRLLYLLEAGRLLELAGDHEGSMRLYAEAEALLDEDLMRASLTVRGTAAQAASLFTNDKALPYRGALYERVLLHTFQALNHLQAGDVTEARIALNKGLRDMRWGTDNLESLSRDTSARLDEQGIRMGQAPPLLNPAYPAANPERSSDNAFLYYLSGLVHQINGDADRAAIDYRNALAFAPGSPPVENALDSIDLVEAGRARLVLIHESDWVSPKIPFSFSIFIGDRSYTLSLPYYPEAPYYAAYPEQFMRVGERTPTLHPLLNLDAVVRRAHQEALPGILLRQVLRIAAKQELQAEAEEADPWLGFAASLYSILSDSPDLRSWQSLPSVIAVSDSTVPAGTHSLRTGFGDAPVRDLRLESGTVTVVRLVTAQGTAIKVESFSFPVYP
jgi:hypothetical protein